MQMNIIESSLAQRGMLPLPSAALVIDMRGIEDDDVIDRLRIEIADLASEMKIHEVNHWRYLTELLSFRIITPLRSEDMEDIDVQEKAISNQAVQKIQDPRVSPKKLQVGLTGQVDASKQNDTLSPFQTEPSGFGNEGKSFDVFRQHIEELAKEINRIRNNRIAAVNDLNRSGVPGRSVRDATVRVIFLTEAENYESLTSTAAYAAKLKEYFGKLERENHQQMISTTIVCLNTSGEAGPPTHLIYSLRWHDDWKHIDSLLISEQFREDSALIQGVMQTYLVELLLYVLLIIPPLTISSPPTSSMESGEEPVALLEDKSGTPLRKGKWVHLPAATYLVGMAAIEHSARWGRRWLNYGLAAQAVRILVSRESEEDLEQKRQRNIVDGWLRSWFRRLEQAFPDKIPGNIPALKAIPNAISVSLPRQEIFSSSGFSFTMSLTTITDLRAYLTELTNTYTSLSPEEDRVHRATTAGSEYPTLQDAVDSIPQIEQRLREWEGRDPALRKGTPFVHAQLEAQRVLSDSNLFTSAKGSIPRARMQLRELGNAISELKNSHEQSTLDLLKRREQLEKRGNDLIRSLEDHDQSFPLLAGKLHLKTPMVVLTIALIFSVAVLATFIGLSWLQSVVFLSVPSLVSITDSLLLVSSSPLAYIFWGIIFLLVVLLTVSLGRALITHVQPAWKVEVYLWCTLFIAGCISFLASFSLDHFTAAGDQTSQVLLAWMTPLYPASAICFILALVILVVEIVWYIWWRERLLEERVQVVRELQHIHRQDVADVSFFIAETVGLQMLLNAGLTDGKGGPGSYYSRVDQLYKRLSQIEREADRQQKLAAQRLVMSISETQPGSASNANEPWLNLKIREEWLDVNALADGFKRFKERMDREADDLKMFSELLLSIMGEETPIEVEQQFREKVIGSGEIRQIGVFMTTLVATVLRFSVAPQSVTSIAPLIERYETLDSQYVHELPELGILIETLNKKVRETTIQPLLTDAQSGGNQGMGNSLGMTQANVLLAADALAIWEQMLWENKDSRLARILIRSGVLAKLMESDDYDARAVMRRLQTRTALFGRSIAIDQPAEIRLILSPSAQSRAFRQSLSIPSRFIIDFPDIERLILLYIQRYKSEPLFVLASEEEQNSASGSNTSSASEGEHSA